MGEYNTRYGDQALQSDGGERNTAFGAYSLYSDKPGTNNCAFGNDAIKNCDGGSYSVGLGVDTLRKDINSGNRNIAVGYYANRDINIVSNTIALGANTQSTRTNAIALGANVQNVYTNRILLGDSQTGVYTHNGYNWTSDQRDKADIRGTALGLDFVMQLRPVDFRWDKRIDYRQDIPATQGEQTSQPEYKQLPKDGSKKRNRYHHGFIAQEIAGLDVAFGGHEEGAIDGDNDMQTLHYQELIAPLVKTLQQQQQTIKDLQQQITKLKTEKTQCV